MHYLMVGGPWHGAFMSMGSEPLARNEHKHVVNPPSPVVFQRASESGVPEPITWNYEPYQLTRYYVGDDSRTYMDVMVWVGGTLIGADWLMLDAFYSAFDKWYQPEYQWKGTQ